MILSSFLGARYARTVPLSLSASLVFEQSYGPIEGDSFDGRIVRAAVGLVGAPIRQSLAMTEFSESVRRHAGDRCGQ